MKDAVMMTHFDTIVNWTIDPLKERLTNLGVEYKDGKMHVVFGDPPEALYIRTAIVTSVDGNGDFKMSLKTETKEHGFVVFHSEHTGNMRLGESVNEILRYLHTFIITKVFDYDLPPSEAVDHLNDLNAKWLTDKEVKAVLYPLKSHRSDWRLRLVHESGTDIAEFLSPDTSGHTCVMIIAAAQEAFKRGLLEGSIRTVETTAMEAFDKATSRFESWYVEQHSPEIRAMVKTRQFRKNQQVI